MNHNYDQQYFDLQRYIQQVEVVSGLQSLDEHERVAIAFNKACRSDTVHESQRGRFVVKPRSQFKNYFTEMCSGSEEGSYLSLIDFVSLNSRLESNKEEEEEEGAPPSEYGTHKTVKAGL